MLITLNTFYDHLSLTRLGLGSGVWDWVVLVNVCVLLNLHVCEFVFDVNDDELCF